MKQPIVSANKVVAFTYTIRDATREELASGETAPDLSRLA